MNLVIASTLGLFNIYILGFGKSTSKKFSKKQNSDNLIIGYRNKKPVIFIFLIFLKIHLLAELFTVEGFTFIIIGCYALGTFLLF